MSRKGEGRGKSNGRTHASPSPKRPARTWMDAAWPALLAVSAALVPGPFCTVPGRGSVSARVQVCALPPPPPPPPPNAAASTKATERPRLALPNRSCAQRAAERETRLMSKEKVGRLLKSLSREPGDEQDPSRGPLTEGRVTCTSASRIRPVRYLIRSSPLDSSNLLPTTAPLLPAPPPPPVSPPPFLFLLDRQDKGCKYP
ncbi:hypothetical protein CDD83_1839 [Cordyceps sp. RAO-2017]|nr:hypothetical protein CDD83_1839 [Cordyceps sp. RAO-2017]